MKFVIVFLIASTAFAGDKYFEISAIGKNLQSAMESFQGKCEKLLDKEGGVDTTTDLIKAHQLDEGQNKGQYEVIGICTLDRY